MIHDSVKTGKNVVMGHHVVIEEDVLIGDDVRIGNFVVIRKGTVIGSGTTIDDLCVLGKAPRSGVSMARKADAALNPLVIGKQVYIAAGCVIYRGVTLADHVFIGDLASIREHVSVGEGSIIGRHAIIELRTVIGKRVTIQTGCYITGDMTIEDDVFIGPCVSSSNDKYMGAGNFPHRGPYIRAHARIGNNATLLPGIVIGAHAVIGAGAVVTRSVPEHEVWVGNPARPLGRDNP